MWEPQVVVPAERRVGDDTGKQSVSLGFFRARTPQGRVVEHGGNNGDFRCKFVAYPDDGMGFALFTNGSLGEPAVQAIESFLTGP